MVSEIQMQNRKIETEEREMRSPILDDEIAQGLVPAVSDSHPWGGDRKRMKCCKILGT